jgi:hypothetical protein
MDLNKRQCAILWELCWERAELLKDRIEYLSSPAAPKGTVPDDHIQKAIDELNTLSLMFSKQSEKWLRKDGGK